MSPDGTEPSPEAHAADARDRCPEGYVSLQVHLAALRLADEKFAAERDRRYAEVNVEREKALKIKETADLAALELARQIQTYKDERANQLREQIGTERHLYATQADLSNMSDKFEAMIKPLVAYANSMQGRGAGLTSGWAYLLGAATLIATLIAIFR